MSKMSEENVCSVCGAAFDCQLFPKLVVTRSERVAGQLAEDEAKSELCLKCWLDDVKKLDKLDLAMIIMGMLGKIRELSSVHRFEPFREGRRDPYSTPYSPPFGSSSEPGAPYIWKANEYLGQKWGRGSVVGTTFTNDKVTCGDLTITLSNTSPTRSEIDNQE